MQSIRLLVLFVAISFLTGCGGGSTKEVGPGLTFNPPSPATIMLPPPTDEQQVEQGRSPTCAPAAGVTIYRVVTGKDYDFNQAIAEMRTSANGTQISDFLTWLNGHELVASATTLPASWAIGMITAELKAGHYVIPYVNESARPNALHVFIIYGVDGDRILISDSNRHLGSKRFAVYANVFQNEWLVNVGTKDRPSALLMFVNSRPRHKTDQKFQNSVEMSKMSNGELLIR